MSKPEFWNVPPNDLCCTCYDENNKATALIAEKGGAYIVCPDCGVGTCFGCLFSAEPLRRGVDIWCAKHSITKSPFAVCDEYVKR